MLQNFFGRIFGYCFSPSINTVPIPHYLYDILNENPFKVLHVINYEFRLGMIGGLIIFAICCTILFERTMDFFSCNRLLTAWLLCFCLMSNLVLLPRILIAEQIKRVTKFIHDFRMVEGNDDPHDMLRNLLWNQIFQTKIYSFSQKIFKNIGYAYFLGISFLLIDSGEHGFFKACSSDAGLKLLCLIIVVFYFVKFRLVQKKIYDPFHQGIFIERRKIRKEEVLQAKEDEKVCSICLLDFEENQEISISECKHIFHEKCIDNWLKIKRKCPLCNKI